MGDEKTGQDGCQVAAAMTKGRIRWRRQCVRKRLREDPKLLWWAVSQVKPLHGVNHQEFVSELTVRVIKSAHNFEQSRGSFTNWLVWQARAVRKELKRYAEAGCRSAAPTVSIEDLTNSIGTTPKEHAWVQREYDKATLAKVFAVASKRDKEVCRKLLKGLSMAELARRMGIARQAISNRVTLIGQKARKNGITWEAPE